MLKINAGISRKIGTPQFGSRGASVNLELELESTAVQDGPALHDRIRKLFALAKSAVEEELGLPRTEAAPAGNGSPPPGAANGGRAPAAVPPGAPNGKAPANGQAPRPASAAQVRAIQSICQHLGLDMAAVVRERLNMAPEALTVSTASGLIDYLKGRSAEAQ